MSETHGAQEDSHVRKRRLAVRQGSQSLARHPDDAFVLANPYPLGTAARRALHALAIAICPPAPAPHPDRLIDDIELQVRHFMAYMPPIAARALWLCIFLLDFAPLYLFQSWHRLHALPRERASRLLAEMVHGRFHALRTIVVAIRGVVLSAYFDQEAVHAAIGYAPLPFMRERIERRKLLLAPAPLKPALAHAGGGR